MCSDIVGLSCMMIMNGALGLNIKSGEVYWEGIFLVFIVYFKEISWGRQALSALLTLCEGNIPVTCGFSSQNAKCQWLGPLVFALELAEQAVEQTVELRVVCVKCPIFDITNNGVSTRKINIPESWLMVYKTYVTAVCTKFELRPTI